MELIDNTSKTLRDDLAAEMKHGSKVSIAAACFSIYAFQKLKKVLSAKSSKKIQTILDFKKNQASEEKK